MSRSNTVDTSPYDFVESHTTVVSKTYKPYPNAKRNEQQIGPFREPNAVIGLMGGSATRGIDYQINLATNGLFRLAKDSNNSAALADPALYSYVYIHVSC